MEYSSWSVFNQFPLPWAGRECEQRLVRYPTPVPFSESSEPALAPSGHRWPLHPLTDLSLSVYSLVVSHP